MVPRRSTRDSLVDRESAVIRRKPETYRIELGGQWTFHDFYQLPRAYEQVYSLLYVSSREAQARSLDRDDSGADLPDEFLEPIGSFPWRGGYSAVNFYTRVAASVPKRDRPRVVSIHYASPGWIELGLVATIAATASKLIKTSTARADELASLYHKIYEQLHTRKLMRIKAKEKEIELAEKQLRFARESADEICALMGLERDTFLKELAPNDLARLKIALSLYRRLRVLAAFEENGRASF